MNTKKILVVYYSLDGNTKFIGTAIASALSAKVLELKPVKDLSSKGFMKLFWGGKQVLFKEAPELLPFDVNPKDFDTLIIGTPVWAGTYTPAIKTFLEQYPVKGKKIALFCCEGGGPGKTFQNFKTALEGNEFIGEIDFVNPLKSDRKDTENKAKKWALELKV